MRLLEFNPDVSLASVIDGIKSVPEKEVTLRLSPDTPWLKNPVNEKILRKAVQQFGKVVHFEGRVEPVSTPIIEPVLSEPEVSIPEEVESVGEAVKDEAGFVVGGDVLAGEAAPAATPSVDPVFPAAPPPATPHGDFKVNGPAGRFGKFGRFIRVALKRWPLTLAAAFGLLLLFGAYVVLALPKAEVKIVVEQRPLEREATLTASTTVTTIDIETRKIPAQLKTSTQSGTLKTATTGTKKIGTNAKGTITIYNGTDFPKTFSAGQKVTSTGGTALKFTLDTTVTVPKRTGTLITGYTPGKEDVAVTAVDIGSQYNLAANTNFTLDNNDATSFQAQNAQPISGGSSKDVQVVTQADLDKLLEDLNKELIAKARVEIEKQGTSDDQVIDKAVKSVATSKTYDKKVGDEASEVSLNLTLAITATVYNAQHLKEILSKTLEQAAPTGYEVSTEGIETSAELSAVEANGDLIFIGRIRANLIPSFDKDELARNLSGKKPNAAETYLKAIPSVLSYQVNIWPNLPEILQAFPRDTKRIKIQVTVQ